MKKIFFKALLAFGAITIPLAGGAAILSSCSSSTTSTTDLSQTQAAIYWRNFVNETHQRLTGNRYNFNSNNIDGTTYGLKDYNDLQELYPLSTTTVEKNHNNYGSYHAYEWLLKTVEDMGYSHLTENISYPEAATITSENTTTSSGTAVKKYTVTPADGTKYYSTGNYNQTDESGVYYSVPASVITNAPSAENAKLLLQTGIVTQPFLWSGMENATHTGNTPAVFNNVGNNLIVTINPDESVESTNEAYDFYIISHYDSTVKLGAGQSQASWGATDNATAVAVNLAILKYFSNSENRAKLKTRLHIVFDDAEEVGILGSHAFVKQYLDASDTTSEDTDDNTSSESMDTFSVDKKVLYPTLASSWGMINIDTIGGGDYLYLHTTSTTSPDASSYNTSSFIRDVLKSASNSIASSKSDSQYKFNIHKQHHSPASEDPSYDLAEGEAPDWVDHSAFYQIAKIPAAAIEATNFELLSAYGSFDGYSQTINRNAWLTYDLVPVDLKKTTDDNGQAIWVLPDNLTLDDLLIKGDIWHSDIDTIEWLAAYIGLSRVYKQLDATYQSIIQMLETTTPKLTDSSYNNSNK